MKFRKLLLVALIAILGSPLFGHSEALAKKVIFRLKNCNKVKGVKIRNLSIDLCKKCIQIGGQYKWPSNDGYSRYFCYFSGVYTNEVQCLRKFKKNRTLLKACNHCVRFKGKYRSLPRRNTCDLKGRPGVIKTVSDCNKRIRKKYKRSYCIRCVKAKNAFLKRGGVRGVCVKQ